MFGLSFLLFGRDPDIAFKTALSLSECNERLSQELRRKRKAFGLHPPPPCVEFFKGDHFVVSRNQSFFYRDNFLVLDGRLNSREGGTFVRASFRLYAPLSVILIFGFAVFFGMAANDVLSNRAPVSLLLIPVVFWTFVGLLYWLMRRLSKSKDDALAAYVRSILEPASNPSK